VPGYRWRTGPIMHGLGASRTPRLDNYRPRRTMSIDDMVNIPSTLMRAGFGIRQATRYPLKFPEPCPPRQAAK
jgi:hypothetical protein